MSRKEQTRQLQTLRDIASQLANDKALYTQVKSTLHNADTRAALFSAYRSMTEAERESLHAGMGTKASKQWSKLFWAMVEWVPKEAFQLSEIELSTLPPDILEAKVKLKAIKAGQTPLPADYVGLVSLLLPLLELAGRYAYQPPPKPSPSHRRQLLATPRRKTTVKQMTTNTRGKKAEGKAVASLIGRVMGKSTRKGKGLLPSGLLSSSTDTTTADAIPFTKTVCVLLVVFVAAIGIIRHHASQVANAPHRFSDGQLFPGTPKDKAAPPLNHQFMITKNNTPILLDNNGMIASGNKCIESYCCLDLVNESTIQVTNKLTNDIKIVDTDKTLKTGESGTSALQLTLLNVIPPKSVHVCTSIMCSVFDSIEVPIRINTNETIVHDKNGNICAQEDTPRGGTVELKCNSEGVITVTNNLDEKQLLNGDKDNDQYEDYCIYTDENKYVTIHVNKNSPTPQSNIPQSVL